MSNKAHTGRCFRATRRTKLRKLRQGADFNAHPIRYKVPLALRPFLTATPGSKNQVRAQFDAMALAIVRYNEHRDLTGKGAAIRAASPD